MSLTGWVLPTVFGSGAFVLFVLLACGLPRRRSGWWPVPLRVLMLVLLNLLVLGLGASLLNNQYAFYTNWNDLAGDPKPTKPQHYGGSLVQAQAGVVGAKLLPHPIGPLPKLPQPGGRVQQFRVTGTRSHITNEVLVRLPERYNPYRRGGYPVILALHGFPGHPKIFRNIDGFFGAVDAAARTGHMSEAIVVMPVINHPSSLDTECVDAPNGPKTETWLANDIPQWVLSHFAARPGRHSWATLGFSFGGWCSAMLGMRHPDVFGGAVVYQGYFRPEFDDDFRPFRPGTPAYEQYDLISLARKNPPPLAMWVLASKPDRLSYPSTLAFVKAARSPLSITAVLPELGGHSLSVWDGKVPETLTWLGRAVPGFRA